MTNTDVVDECRSFFNFMLPSETIEKRANFESKFFNCNILLYYLNIMSKIRPILSVFNIQFIATGSPSLVNKDYQ